MTLKPVNLKGFSDMGLTHIAVTLKKNSSDEQGSYTATFLIDTGAMDSMVPASELHKVGIKPVGRHYYELANGEHIEYQYGVAEMSFLGEVIGINVLFGPENTQPILGVIALESAGFLVDPKHQRLRKIGARPLKRMALKSVA
jgi:clan AA aspartic protease